MCCQPYWLKVQGGKCALADARLLYDKTGFGDAFKIERSTFGKFREQRYPQSCKHSITDLHHRKTRLKANTE